MLIPDHFPVSDNDRKKGKWLIKSIILVSFFVQDEPNDCKRKQFLLTYHHRNNTTLTLHHPQINHGTKDQTWYVRRLENWFEILDKKP